MLDKVGELPLGTPAKLNQQLAMMELRLIRKALEKHNWVQTVAAESLGLRERILRYKIKKYNLTKN